MHSLYWVGKYESDILHCDIFSGSITYYGSNQNNNYAFCKKKLRINSKLSNEFRIFIIDMIKKQISIDVNCRFMFYNQNMAHEIIALYPLYSSYIVGLNTFSIIDALNNKLYNRLWFANIIDTIPIKTLSKNECNFQNLKKIFPDHSEFIIQKNISSGGKGTYLLSPDNNQLIISKTLYCHLRIYTFQKFLNIDKYLLSSYLFSTSHTIHIYFFVL